MADDLSHHVNLALATSNYESYLENKILNAENFDKEYQKLKEKTIENEKNQIKTDFSVNGRGLLLHKNKLYIPNAT